MGNNHIGNKYINILASKHYRLDAYYTLGNWEKTFKIARAIENRDGKNFSKEYSDSKLIIMDNQYSVVKGNLTKTTSNPSAQTEDLFLRNQFFQNYTFSEFSFSCSGYEDIPSIPSGKNIECYFEEYSYSLNSNENNIRFSNSQNRLNPTIRLYFLDDSLYAIRKLQLPAPILYIVSFSKQPDETSFLLHTKAIPI